MRLAFCLALVLVGCATKKFQASYETPEATFQTWKYAASKPDFPLLLQTYATSARSQIEKEIAATSLEGLKEMQREAKSTKFEIQKVVFEEDKAYVRVERRLKKQSDIEILNMVKEGSGWKLVP